MIIKYIFMGWCHIKERTIFNISSKLDCIIYSYYSPFSVKLCIPAHCHGIYPPPMKRTPFPASSRSAVAVQLTLDSGHEPIPHLLYPSGSLKCYCMVWLSLSFSVLWKYSSTKELVLQAGYYEPPRKGKMGL